MGNYDAQHKNVLPGSFPWGSRSCQSSAAGVDLDGDDQDLEDLWQIVEGVHLKLMAHVDGHGAHQVAGMLTHCRSPTTRNHDVVP